MEIRFQTKEESNKQQQEDFLKLSKVERIYSFLRMSERISRFPVKNRVDKNKDNFVIIIKSKLECQSSGIKTLMNSLH